jgi:lipopolysaccharide export system permease protein
MPRLLYTYMINQVLAPFYASLLILTSILFLGKLIPLLNIILDYHIGFGDFVRLYAYYTPQLLLFTLPMSSMMGIILGTTHSNNENELMVLKASGISLYRMLPPVILVALCTALLTGLFSVYLIPAGTRAKVELAFQLAKDRVERSIHEKRFSESFGDIVLYADDVDQGSKTWKGVYISNMRDSRHPVTIIAETGKISADSGNGIIAITLHNGIVNRTAANADQTINFEQYDMVLPLETPSTNPLAKIGKSGLQQRELVAKAEQLGPNTREGAAYLNEFHQRLALPVSCFILALLGFPLGFLSGPRRKTVGIPLGLLIFIFYYVLLTGAKTISESLILPAAVAVWLPNIIFLILTIVFIRSVAEERYTLFLEKFYDITFAISRKYRRRRRGNQ